ncbi:uncharacterized protein [Palaemon carinicauda]|uniref:uncharacterized protein n=1 Tax=Palaemon carinicauda TaxID=392227 RepID=UPI0035B5B59F
MRTYLLILSYLLCCFIIYTRVSGPDLSLPLTLHRTVVGWGRLCEGREFHAGYITKYVWVAAVSVVFLIVNIFIRILIIMFSWFCCPKLDKSRFEISRLTEEEASALGDSGSDHITERFNNSRLRLDTDSLTNMRRRKNIEEKSGEHLEAEITSSSLILPSLRYYNADLSPPPLKRDGLVRVPSPARKLFRFTFKPKDANDLEVAKLVTMMKSESKTSDTLEESRPLLNSSFN